VAHVLPTPTRLSPFREAEAHTADQVATDIRRVIEQMTADARKEIAQLSADASKTIGQAADDARKVGREVAEGMAAEITQRMAGWESYGHSATSYSRTGRSITPLVSFAGDYQQAADTSLWFRLQRIRWIYVDLLGCASRRSLEVYFETLTDAEEITAYILQQRATTLLAKHRVESGDTLSTIAIRYYGDASEPRWRKIHEANREAIGGDPHQIEPGDPQLIKPGETLNIPA
jgi:nucleoid-associated protein YgaU